MTDTASLKTTRNSTNRTPTELAGPQRDLQPQEIELSQPIVGRFSVLDHLDVEVAKGVLAEPTDRLVVIASTESLRVMGDHGAVALKRVAPSKPREHMVTVVVNGGARHEVALSDIWPVLAAAENSDPDITDTDLHDGDAGATAEIEPPTDTPRARLQAKDVVAVEPGSVFVGEGFYGREVFEGAPLRWLGSRGRLTVAGLVEPTDLKLTIEIEPGPALGPDSSLTLATADGTTLGRHAITEAGSLDFAIPTAVQGSVLTEVELIVDNPSPREFAGDPRNLAVRCNSVSVSEGLPAVIDLREGAEPVTGSVGFVAGWNAENDGDGHVRWLYEYGEILVTYTGQDPQVALMAAVRPGPCLDPVHNRLQLLRPDGSKIAETTVITPDLVAFPLSDDDLAIGTSRLTLRLVNPSPRRYLDDDRELNLQINDLYLVPAPHADDRAQQHRNRHANDVPKATGLAQTVSFGRGWYPPELADESHFRWMGAESELRYRPNGDDKLVLHFRSGPDLAAGTVSILDTDRGELLEQVDLSGGQASIDVVAPTRATTAERRLTIRTLVNPDSETATDRRDPRVLSIRLVGVDQRSADDDSAPPSAAGPLPGLSGPRALIDRSPFPHPRAALVGAKSVARRVVAARQNGSNQ